MVNPEHKDDQHATHKNRDHGQSHTMAHDEHAGHTMPDHSMHAAHDKPAALARQPTDTGRHAPWSCGARMLVDIHRLAHPLPIPLRQRIEIKA